MSGFGYATLTIYLWATIIGDINRFIRALEDRENCLVIVTQVKNSKGDLVFHLSVSVGHLSTINLLASSLRQNEFMDLSKEQNKDMNTALHAALKKHHKEVAFFLINADPEVSLFLNSEGKSPLYMAAEAGWADLVKLMMGSKLVAIGSDYVNDRINGKSLVHAAFTGKSRDSSELLNKQGQNIVHVVAKNGKDNVIKYVLKTLELEKFVNERDEKGNTPLHLATMHWRPKIVNSLTWDKKVRLELVNDAGLTALDVAEKYIGTAPPFRKRLTWMALKSAGAPRSKHQKPNRHSSRKWKAPNMENYKERINTLMLVLTIIATVTFTAGFTVPGGYKSSTPDEGMTTLLNSNYFKAFLICDTIAMYSSVIAIVTLIWAHLGDLNLVLFALRLAMPLLGLSLAMMSLAFMAGLCLVVSNLAWLDDVIQIMGMIFLSTIMALFVPLYFPDTSRSRTLRFVSYYVLSWVMFASGSYGDDDDQEEL
ncbi:hypothetical protein ACSBR2_027494 [Camellia fascicularis]